jgi:hypothetical protein
MSSFRVGENESRTPDRSAQLNGMKIAAIAFGPDRGRIAAVSSERKVINQLGRSKGNPQISERTGFDSIVEGFNQMASLSARR